MNIKYKTFLIFIFTFLSIIYSVQGAQTIVDRSFDSGENLTTDQITWTVIIASNPDKERVMIKSLFDMFSIDKGRCEKVDYYNFCFNGIDSGEFELYEKAKLVVSKQDCVAYNNSDNQTVCKAAISGSCIKDNDCFSNRCLHGMCVMRTNMPLCGDGYCDKDEGCRNDCLQDIIVTSTNPYTVELVPKYDWVGTRFVLKNNTPYIITSNSDYYIDGITKINTLGIIDSNNETLLPEFNKGALIGKACNKTVLISSNTVIKTDNDCELLLRVNEKKVYDNNGKITVSITLKDTQEKIDAEKKNLELELQKAKDQLKAAENSKTSTITPQTSPTPVVVKKESSSGGGWAFFLILLMVGGYFLYKHIINKSKNETDQLKKQLESEKKKSKDELKSKKKILELEKLLSDEKQRRKDEQNIVDKVITEKRELEILKNSIEEDNSKKSKEIQYKERDISKLIKEINAKKNISLANEERVHILELELEKFQKENSFFKKENENLKFKKALDNSYSDKKNTEEKQISHNKGDETSINIIERINIKELKTVFNKNVDKDSIPIKNKEFMSMLRTLNELEIKLLELFIENDLKLDASTVKAHIKKHNKADIFGEKSVTNFMNKINKIPRLMHIHGDNYYINYDPDSQNSSLYILE